MPRENKTKYAVLGLLTYAPLSGYDIRRIYEQSLGNFWSESYGAIYPILKRLEEEGLATREVERQAGKPDRNVYTITDLGREELHRWLAQPPEPIKERVELLLKLFHGWEVGPAVMIEHVKQTRAEHEALLQRYAHYDEVMTRDNEPPSPYWLMTVSCGQHNSKALHRVVRRDHRQARATPRGAARRRRELDPDRPQGPGGERMNANLPGAALLLDGRRDDEPTLALAHDALVDGLAAGGWAVDDWRLRDDKIAWCAGCFKCWTHDARRVRAPRRRARGRRALGAQRPRRPAHAGHVRRLLVGAQEGARPRHPDPAAVSWTSGAARRTTRSATSACATCWSSAPCPPARRDGPEARTFRRLVERNTRNMEPPRWAAGVLEEGAGEWEVRVAVDALLAEVGVARPATRSAPAGRRWSHERSADGPAADRQPQAGRELVRVARRVPARGAREARREDADAST